MGFVECVFYRDVCSVPGGGWGGGGVGGVFLFVCLFVGWLVGFLLSRQVRSFVCWSVCSLYYRLRKREPVIALGSHYGLPPWAPTRGALFLHPRYPPQGDKK